MYDAKINICRKKNAGSFVTAVPVLQTKAPANAGQQETCLDKRGPALSMNISETMNRRQYKVNIKTDFFV